MKTTITQYADRPCYKCGGAGFLSQFQHRKGGECFACGATGKGASVVTGERDMEYHEIVAELRLLGIEIVDLAPVEYNEDNFLDMFKPLDPAIVEGARMLLAAI
jgi:hypothetical protein